MTPTPDWSVHGPRLAEALEAILSPDLLLNSSPELFGGYAARRMQEQARAALHPKEETP